MYSPEFKDRLRREASHTLDKIIEKHDGRRAPLAFPFMGSWAARVVEQYNGDGVVDGYILGIWDCNGCHVMSFRSV